MQAFGLTVIDFDGDKLSALAAQLQAEGYSVVTLSLSQDQAVADAGPPLVEEVVSDGDASDPDNSKPFKCPLCGRTYNAQVICDVQHDPADTQPTADVLNGTSPAAAVADPSPEAAAPSEPSGAAAQTTDPQPAAASSQETAAAPPTPAVAAPPAAPAAPDPSPTPPPDPVWPQ